MITRSVDKIQNANIIMNFNRMIEIKYEILTSLKYIKKLGDRYIYFQAYRYRYGWQIYSVVENQINT